MFSKQHLLRKTYIFYVNIRSVSDVIVISLRAFELVIYREKVIIIVEYVSLHSKRVTNTKKLNHTYTHTHKKEFSRINHTESA